MGLFNYITHRKRLGPLVGLVLLCCQLLGVREATGQIAVVVNQGNEIEGVTLQSLQDIYVGNKVSWSNNYKIFPVTMKSSLEVSQSFFAEALGKSSPGDEAGLDSALSIGGRCPAESGGVRGRGASVCRRERRCDRIRRRR